MARGAIYTWVQSLTNPTTTNPMIQIKAGATQGYVLHELVVTQVGSTTSANGEIRIRRLSAAATVTTGATSDWGAKEYRDNATNIALSFGTSATGTVGSSTGTTTGGILFDRGWNLLNGLYYLPTPDTQIDIPAGQILAIYTPTAPAATYIFEITLEES